MGAKVWRVLHLALVVLAAAAPLAAAGAEPVRRVLCTTFPIYQFTRNVTQGREGVAVSLLLPAQLGCPHDYALPPQDMRQLARADVLVVNGLGLEEFLGAPVREANPRVRVVEASAGIEETLPYGDEPEEPGHEAAGTDAEKESPGHRHAGHHHAGVNPHLFASPRQAARMVRAIAAGLAAADPAGAGVYTRNAGACAARLEALADEFAALGRALANRRVVTQHAVFDYLARDMGLEIVGVVQAHPGQDPSAAEMLRLVKTIRERGAGAVFTEPQYPARVAQAVAREAGIPLAELDPVASGPPDAPLDHYERAMRKNLETLRATLGSR